MTVLIVAIFSTTCGCSSKPVNTQKRSAKHNSSEQTNVVEASPSQQNCKGLSQEELDDIRHSGENICFPSKVRILEMQENEILREIEVDSGLSGEAVNFLLALRDKLAGFKGHSNELTIKNSSPAGTKFEIDTASSGYKQTAKNLKFHNSLVNSGNKSSVFSAVAEAPPNYFDKLANLLTLLRDQEGYQLKVTGYNDTQRTAFDNIKLLSRPERESESYLQIMVELKF